LFLVALGVRLGTVALGVWLASQPPQVIPPDDPATIEVRERIESGPGRILEPWFRWDAVWIANISRHGYAGATDRGGRLGVAFLPAMPASMAAAEAVGLNPFWFSILIANLVGAAGAAVLAQVAAHQLNERAAGWRTLALLLAFPTAFFFSAPYNESFGLLFTALALAAWQRNQPVQAGLFAAGGSLARMTGVALGVAAVIDWLTKRTRAEFPRALATTIGSFAGLALFWCFLWWSVGDPLAGVKAQVAWGRPELSIWNPWRAIQSIYDPKIPHWGEAVLVIGFAVLGVRAWWKHGAFWGVLTLVPVAQMFASGTLLSGHRLILAALPAFIELADLTRRPVWFLVVLLGFALPQFVLLNHYVHWRFAG